MTGNKIMVICLLTGFMVFAPGQPRAQDSLMPGCDQTFSPEKEKQIDALAAMAMPVVFASLRSTEFFDEEAYLDKAICAAFNHRRPEAVRFALGIIRSTQIKMSPTGAKDFYIAKQTLHLFPDPALDGLLDLYGSGGPKVRRNIIEVLGQMTGGQPIRTVLVNALDDASFCGDLTPESVGEPLRICDVAYNQLVLRYKIKNIPRVIGGIHAIDMRDRHIRELKNMLESGNQRN